MSTQGNAAAAIAPPAPEAKPKAPRILPRHFDKLREAKFDLAAEMRRELTEGQVLEMLLDEVLDDWIQRRVGPRRKTRGGEK